MRLSGPHGPLAALGMTSPGSGSHFPGPGLPSRPRHPDRPVRLAFRRPRADRLAAGSRPQPPRDAGRHRGGMLALTVNWAVAFAPVGYEPQPEVPAIWQQLPDRPSNPPPAAVRPWGE